MPKADTALDPAALLDKAQRQTGLSDFGGKTFHEPFEILLQSLRDEAKLNARGVFMMHRTMLRLLTNRLRTEQAFADSPALAETPIPRPLYVIGFPRTGTTLLHNLLACDPAARWMRLWEGLYPAPAPQSLEDDPRIAEVEEWAAGFEKVAPRLAAAHKLARGAGGMSLAHRTYLQRSYLRATRPCAHLLALAGQARGGCRHSSILPPPTPTAWRPLPWQSLGVQGAAASTRFGWFARRLPEARIVQTHRDPATVLPSLCSLCEILRGAASDAVDKPAIGAHWHARLKAIFEKATAVRATAAEGQILDIQYADLVADPIATVQHIYAHHGYEFTEPFEAAMRQWLAANRQHKHGAHRYTLEEYGLSEAQVREDFSDYAKEFGL